jgi:signal transduction histidine kinase
MTATTTPVPTRGVDGTSRDELLPFRPAVLAVRGAAAVASLGLAAPAFAEPDWRIIVACTLVVLYNAFRIMRPLRYYDDDTLSLVRVVFEIGFHVVIVVGTGYWESPFVFTLITAVTISGFARGFGFALRVAVASALAIGLPYLLDHPVESTTLRTATQWTLWLVLIAFVAGYARRITGETARQHTLALDRLGRLADANLLLYSLHRVAQTLPASLDLEDSLDTTFDRLKDLFRCDAIVVLLLDETDGLWVTKRRDGPKPADTYTTDALPRAMREALATTHPVVADRLTDEHPGLGVRMRSGLYAVLRARDATVGLIALESLEERQFRLRDQELLDGFVEPAGLAIDNARWFGRLRTVGADEERTRIARDLHDRIGQSLAYLAFELDRIIKVDGKGEPVSDHLANLRNDVRSVVGEVRDTLYDLRTDVTESQDVVETLQGFLDRVAARSGMTTHVDAEVGGRLPLLQERELWRIAQEAVTNVERHAHATQVTVRWRTDGRRALLQIVDDGVGFPEGRAGRLDSYGILGMRERASSIGATLDIAGAPGRGTTVSCEIATV